MSKKVLLTGGAGFIGHHVIKFLMEKTNWEIISIDRLDYSGNLNRIDSVISNFSKEERKRIKIVYHDLKAEINPLMSKNMIGSVNIILHLAASSHVDRSITYPMEFVMDNVVGTCNILNFARDQKDLERFIYFSTDEVFGPAPKGINYTEKERYNSSNPYSASKAGGEELAVAYENTYNLPIFITHTMNVFGERQHPEKYIPMCIRKIYENEKIFVHSDKSKTVPGSRFYIHGSDVAEAIYFLLNLNDQQLYEVYKPDYGGLKCPKFNVVGKEEIDNLSLAKMIAQTQNKDLNYEMIDFHSSRPGHDLRYALSGEAMKKLGWEPKISLSERIKQVTEWYLKNTEWLY